jgi:UDP-3-O-[3-hydroxymyristoyl] glucosamine N-acyltransferase
MSLTLQALAERIGATLEGDASLTIEACRPIDDAGPGDVTFVANTKYLRHLETTKAGAVIVGGDVKCPPHLNRLVAKDPYFAFRQAMVALHGYRVHPEPMAAEGGVSDLACVHPEATIGEGCSIHPFAVVERNARVGARTVLYPGSYVAEHASVGEDCILFPNSVVYDHCVLGHRVTLHSCAVVGHDGFGYATHQGAHHKIPQTGVVVLEDDVEIGAGCAIERAAMGETRVGAGTKFADLISIGHGTTIGKHCLLVSLVGISGSVEVGNYVALGGQVGVAGHLSIGDMVQVAGKAAVVADVPAGMKVGGIPAVELDQAKRNALAGMDLYGLSRRVRDLERAMKALESKRETTA